MPWPTSPRFQQTIPQSHEIRVRATLTTTWGDVIPLDLETGTVTCQGGQNIRRTANLTLIGRDTLYSQLSSPGTTIAVETGIKWSGTQEELVPVIVGELSSAARELSSGIVTVTLADYGQRLAATTYTTSYSPPVGATRTDVIAAAVTDAIPGTRINQQSTDTGAVTSAQTWDDRTSLIASLTIDGGTEAFFAPDGSYTIRNTPSITDPATTTLTGGNVKTLARTRPLDRLYNTVLVRPSNLDGSQDWTQVQAQVADPANARHPDRIGVRPYVWNSPTILTTDEAETVAQILLDKVLGTTETLAITTIADPSLEAGDIARIVNPTDIGREIITHYIDGFTIELTTGNQTISTRSYTELVS